MMRRLTGVLTMVAALVGCAVAPAPTGTNGLLLTNLDWRADGWMHLPIRGRTDYAALETEHGVGVSATGAGAASGLIRRVDWAIDACPEAAWEWRVDQVQESADLNLREKDDVGASLFLLFGDPGFVTAPDPVPTLRYVWTNTRHQPGAVIESPYMPGVVRSLVLRVGRSENGAWRAERRNVRADFERAFGGPPDGRIHAVALFTDNDQTKETVRASYAGLRMICR